MERRPFIALALVAVLACQAKLFKISIADQSTSQVPGATLFTDLLPDAFGFDDFLDMDLTESEELANQGVEDGDIKDVALVDFVLRATQPQGADLSFLSSLAVYVEAPGVPRALIASQQDFPPGVSEIAFDLETVDLTPFVISESMTFTVDATGQLPEDATTIVASYEVEVGVTGQGCVRACNEGQGTE
jgi:hypothetical protein